MAFNSSLSGMRAANADLNVTSHNIANVNTTGFKESRAEFAEVFSSTGYGLLRNGIGAGVRLTNVAQQFSQGDINQTGRYLDMAVDKEGFFTVSNNGTNVYTRAGNFQRDPNGYVTTPEGYRLQVFPPRADGVGKRAFEAMDRLFREYGLMVRTAADTIAFSPPLIISESEIEELIGKLRTAIRAVA